jgi:hypothetical protein
VVIDDDGKANSRLLICSGVSKGLRYIDLSCVNGF